MGPCLYQAVNTDRVYVAYVHPSSVIRSCNFTQGRVFFVVVVLFYFFMHACFSMHGRNDTQVLVHQG